MWDLFIKGGPVMFLLLGCSFIGLYVTILKVMFLSQNKLPNKSIKTIKQFLLSEGKAKTIQRLHQKQNLSSTIIGSSIKYSDLPLEEIEASLKSLTQKTVVKIDNGLNIISSIITVTPILGILGTVLGLMDIFNVISGGGIGQPELLSSGIAEALITTVSGLSVAIPFIFIYQWLTRENDLFLIDINLASSEIVRFCKSEGVQP
ncbi:MotA/TolQ/ExbB proton channel family protein [bacterium]|jgi:biopolymer transport protein ExbB|nr:MotA/TolQ/ExbB proton channel family protein [bacterium]